MINYLKYLFYYLKYLLSKKKTYKTKWEEELPDSLRENTFYVIGNKKYPFKVISKCPRKLCNQIVQVNVLQSPPNKNNWQVTEETGGTISLRPSVWLKKKCRCHYWVRNGKVEWCDRLSFQQWKKIKNNE